MSDKMDVRVLRLSKHYQPGNNSLHFGDSSVTFSGPAYFVAQLPEVPEWVPKVGEEFCHKDSANVRRTVDRLYYSAGGDLCIISECGRYYLVSECSPITEPTTVTLKLPSGVSKDELQAALSHIQGLEIE